MGTSFQSVIFLESYKSVVNIELNKICFGCRDTSQNKEHSHSTYFDPMINAWPVALISCVRVICIGPRYGPESMENLYPFKVVAEAWGIFKGMFCDVASMFILTSVLPSFS